MHKSVLSFLSVVLSLGFVFPQSAVEVQQYKEAAVIAIDDMRGLTQQMVDMIFSFGELGFQEFETSNYLVNILKENGFEVERGLSGIPTAWLARWGSGTPVIAFGSDLDGIPKASQKPGVAYRDPIVEGSAASVIIFKVSPDGDIAELSLENVMHDNATLPNAPESREGRRGNQRMQTITDLAFIDGYLYIAGLSNEEFASKLRSIAYPFDNTDGGTSVEIFHGAHGKLETRSPVRTFAAYDIDGQSHLLAAYTCTPLAAGRGRQRRWPE